MLVHKMMFFLETCHTLLATTFVNRNCDTECTLNDLGQSKCLPTKNWSEPLPTGISKTLKIQLCTYNSHYHPMCSC